MLSDMELFEAEVQRRVNKRNEAAKANDKASEKFFVALKADLKKRLEGVENES